ncbi:hypothetical protein [Pseudomonas sp. Marseille-QA0892]
MAKTQQQRSSDCADRRKARGEEELRMRTLAGTRQCLADLMRWHGIEEQGEAMTLMLHHLHALGPKVSASYFASPRHEISISPNVERKLMLAYQREAMKVTSGDPSEYEGNPRLPSYL